MWGCRSLIFMFLRFEMYVFHVYHVFRVVFETRWDSDPDLYCWSRYVWIHELDLCRLNLHHLVFQFRSTCLRLIESLMWDSTCSYGHCVFTWIVQLVWSWGGSHVWHVLDCGPCIETGQWDPGPAWSHSLIPVWSDVSPSLHVSPCSSLPPFRSPLPLLLSRPPLFPISRWLGYSSATCWHTACPLKGSCHISYNLWHMLDFLHPHGVRPILVLWQSAKTGRQRWVQTFLVVKGRNLQLSNKSLRLNPFCDWLQRATWHTLYEHELYAVVYSLVLPLYQQQTKAGAYKADFCP